MTESWKLFWKSRKMFKNREIFCYKSREKISNSMTSNSMNLPANIYLFKVNTRNTRKRWEICSKLIMKTAEWRQWYHTDIFMLTWTYSSPSYSVSIVDFEQVNVSWVFITQDKSRNKRNLLHCINLFFKLTSQVRGLSIKCEECDLFITPLSRYLTTLKFIETKERKNML